MAQLEEPSEAVRSEPGAKADLDRAHDEIASLRTRLLEAEQRLAAVPELERRSAELERVTSSLSWRATSPLRALGRPFRRALLRLQGTIPGQVLARLLQALRR